MIEGALWRKWVFYNIPLILFVFVLLFPFYWMIITTFRPDGELYRPWNRFWYVTWPLLLPVTMVVMLFSVIQTFADFQLVYVMTGGGPANATHLFATYAYQLGIGTGLLSEGAAISLAMFPFLFIIVVVQLLYIRRVETR